MMSLKISSYKILNSALDFSLCLLLFICFSKFSFAQTRPEIFGIAESKEKITYDSEVSFEVLQDQLRTENTSNKTNIRNLSLGLNFNQKTSKLRFEFLGEQNPVNNDVNMNVGEFYLVTELDFLNSTELFIGASKLEYGILNDLDGVLSFLPTYYSILYDLPRGIDTGFGFKNDLIKNKLSISGFLYLGRNLRAVDSQVQSLDVAPHHFKISFENEKSVFSLNYFGRKYETLALTQGFGFDYKLSNLYLFKNHLKLDFGAETYYLSTSLNSVQNQGLTALIHPEFEYKSVLLRALLSFESWSQGPSNSEETLNTISLGFKVHPNIKAYVERAEILNLTNNLVKEQSYQFRVISEWSL